MKDKILIVDDDANILRTLELGIGLSQGSKLDLLFAENGAQAIDILKDNQVAVVATDLYMPEVDGFELVAYLTRHHPEVPCIVMTGFGGSEEVEHIENSGVFRFLEKPFSIVDLSNAITDAVSFFKQDRPKELLAPSAFIKLLQADRKSCILEISTADDSKGLLYLIDGRLCDAKYRNLQGEKAALHIMGWEEVSFNIVDIKKENVETTIKANLDKLIAKVDYLKNGGGKEENEAAKPLTHPEILFQAIQNARACKPKMAQRSLTKILKEDHRNSKAWLWLARTTDNIKTANVALENASLIEPHDKEIIKEISKVKSAVASVGKGNSKIAHCFFCWAPVQKEHTICHYCHALLDITENFLHSTFFDSKDEPDLTRILKSFQQFTKATLLDRENIEARFCLAMAHINMSQWDEALDELLKAKSIHPKNFPYQKQLEILSSGMDNLGSFFTEEDQAEEPSVVDGKTSKRDKEILVVEDSTTTRKVIRQMLTREGYKVIEAKDGIEAIAKFQEHTPDMILLDIIMPGIDGYQTLAILKKDHKLDNIPVIMLTAKDTLIDKLKGKVAGSTEYMTKPFNALDLIKKVNGHLS